MQSWKFNVTFLFVFSAYSFIAFASPPKPPINIALNDIDAVNRYLTQLSSYWLEEENISGLSITLVSNHNITYAGAFGNADREMSKKTQPDTVYRLGAISGVFTASLVMKLVELDLLKLEQGIKHYLPELNFQYYDKKNYTITIENLLTHHGGLPLSRYAGSWLAEQPDFLPLLQQLNQSYASFPPNTIYAYSNIGYSLLAIIIERVTKLSFAEAMQRYILSPLALKNTHIKYSNKIQTKLAVGYRKAAPQTMLFPRDVASLGIYSTSADLSQLMRMLMSSQDKSILSASSIENMINPHNQSVVLDLDKRIGFGLQIDGINVNNGGPVLWRSGTTLGFRAQMAFLPDHDIGIVVLSNDANSREAISNISENALQLMLLAKKGIESADKERVIDKKKSKTIFTFADYYSSFLGYIPIKKEPNDLSASLLGWRLNLIPTSEGWYDLEYDLFGFIPINVSWIANVKIRPSVVNNKKILIALYKGKQFLIGSFFEFTKPSPTWQKKLGEYRIINADALLESVEVSRGELKMVDDKLFFVYEIPRWIGLTLHVPLRIVSEKTAIIPGLGTGLNESVHVVQFGNKEYLEYSGYLLEKIEHEATIFDFFETD